MARARIHETLARATLAAPPPPGYGSWPGSLERARFGLERLARTSECRASRAASLDTEESRAALDRLRAYGDQRIAECTGGTELGATELAPPSPRRRNGAAR